MGMKKEVVYEVRDEVEINYLFIKKGGFTEPAELYVIGTNHKAYMVPNELILHFLKDYCIVVSQRVTDRRRKRKIESIDIRGEVL